MQVGLRQTLMRAWNLSLLVSAVDYQADGENGTLSMDIMGTSLGLGWDEHRSSRKLVVSGRAPSHLVWRSRRG